MHLYFCGIGGTGLTPLANIALDAGYQVSGSDILESKNTKKLEERGVKINLGQTQEKIQKTHQQIPIDWFIHTAAIPKNHPELNFAQKEKLQISKRDGLLKFLIKQNKLNLIAVAGTHGKTTITAMIVWIFKKLKIPVSYLIGSNISFGQSGEFDPKSQFFVLECDEFDRNFLEFHPQISIIPSIDYDHPDCYPTKNDYLKSFVQFFNQSEKVFLWLKDFLEIENQIINQIAEFPEQKEVSTSILKKIQMWDQNHPHTLAEVKKISIPGLHNRQNAQLVFQFFQEILEQKLINSSFFSSNLSDSFSSNWKQQYQELISQFPGTERRFERLRQNLYSDYAHHPTEIKAIIQTARELLTQRTNSNNKK